MQSAPLDPDELAARVGSWLSGRGPESDVVVSSRVRLARNLAGSPFPLATPSGGGTEILDRVRPLATRHTYDGDASWVPLEGASDVLRWVLFERNLATREMVGSEASTELAARAVVFWPQEDLAILMGEEDHLRLQGLASGLDLEGALGRVVALDRTLEGDLEYQLDERLGFLTACPSNVGTGMRASVMLHLPGLGAVRSELKKVFHAAQHTGLAVRGLHGEGSRAAGDLYQVSNQVTLGASEEELVEGLLAIVRRIVTAERTMREALLESRREPLRDRVARSLATLRTGMSMHTEAALRHLSWVRLGHHLELVQGLDTALLNRLAVQIQRGHLQALHGSTTGELLEPSERRKLRASLLRAAFSGRG